MARISTNVTSHSTNRVLVQQDRVGSRFTVGNDNLGISLSAFLKKKELKMKMKYYYIYAISSLVRKHH